MATTPPLGIAAAFVVSRITAKSDVIAGFVHCFGGSGTVTRSYGASQVARIGRAVGPQRPVRRPARLTRCLTAGATPDRGSERVRRVPAEPFSGVLACTAGLIDGFRRTFTCRLLGELKMAVDLSMTVL